FDLAEKSLRILSREGFFHVNPQMLRRACIFLTAVFFITTAFTQEMSERKQPDSKAKCSGPVTPTCALSILPASGCSNWLRNSTQPEVATCIGRKQLWRAAQNKAKLLFL